MGKLILILLAVVLSSFAIFNLNNSLYKGLIAYYPLNESGGVKLFDKTKVMNYTATIPTGCTWGLKKCLSFDGTTALVPLAKTSCLNLETSPMTISIWCYRTASGNRYPIADHNAANTTSGSQIGISSGRILWAWGNPAAQLFGTTVETLGKWRHVVGTRSGSTGAWTMATYSDGVQDGLLTTVNNPCTQAVGGVLTIGTTGSYTAGTFKWNGLLKNLMIWNRALSAAEVRQLYTQQYTN